MKPTKVLLGARIKELRKARGLSQNVLSEKIGIEAKHLSRIEVGNSYPSLDTLERISRALGVEMKDVFEFDYDTSKKGLLRNIRNMLGEASPEDLKLIHKIIRSIVR
jgi:transcriptional regulator with XRE-family HTH domain